MNLIQSALQTMKNLSLVFVNVKGPSYLFKKEEEKLSYSNYGEHSTY